LFKHSGPRTALVGLIAAGALALTACAGPADDGTVTITYESWTPSQETMDSIIDAFEAENPDIKVEAKLLPYADYVTAIKTELASGTGPDVFDLQAGGMLAEFQSLLEPLDELATAEIGADWANVYNEEALTQASIDGVAYGLPHGFQTAGGLWVNVSLLEANGLAVPTTWDDLVAASATLRAAGAVPLAIGAKDDWMLIDVFSAISNGVAPGEQYDAMEGNGDWTSPGLVDSFDAFSALFTEGIAQDGAAGATTYTDTFDLFADGKAAFFANGSWNQDMFVNAADRIGGFEAAVVQMPTPEGLAPVIGGIGGLLAVNKDSDQKSAAFKLAQFMSSGAGQQILIDGSLDFAVTAEAVEPGVDISDNAREVRTQLTALLADHLAGYREVPDAGVKSALGQALLKLAAGTISPADAAAEVQAAAEG